MALGQGEVDAFMRADKVVPGSARQPLGWTTFANGDRVFRGPVEINHEQVGSVHLHAIPRLERCWYFKLLFKGVEVYRVEVHGSPVVRHCNTGCPPQFARKVTTQEQEHVYVEGFDCKCARALPDLAGASDPEMFAAFCEGANLAFEPPYESPLVNVDIPML